jgi:hypothetical protein
LKAIVSRGFVAARRARVACAASFGVVVIGAVEEIDLGAFYAD